MDGRHAKLLHEHGLLPVYYFPEAEVRMDLLEPSEHTTRCPWKGTTRYYSVRVGDAVSQDAAWTYPEPLEGAPPIAGHLAFHWDRMDEWLEEDQPAIVHARDPYHRVDVCETSRHVRVEVGGEIVAETRRARVLFETGLPPRWYVPPEDVRSALLVPSETRTGCAYKGYASYWSIRADGVEEDDVVWCYPDPLRDGEPIEGYLCFFNERVDLYIDGELQERPVTQWSKR